MEPHFDRESFTKKMEREKSERKNGKRRSRQQILHRDKRRFAPMKM